MRCLIAVFVLTLVLATAARSQEIYEGASGVYYTDTLTVKLAAHPGGNLVIKSAAHLTGTLLLQKGDDDRILVKYVKRAKAGSRSQAIDFIDLISVSAYDRPSEAIIELRAPNPAPWNDTDYYGSVTAVVILPAYSVVEIDAYYFDVTVDGPLRSVVIPESLGRLEISHITEKLEVNTANRRVNLKDVNGNISASTTNSSLIAEQITSSEGQARFSNDGGDIRVTDFKGAINAKNSYGRITIEGFRPVGQSSFIRGASAPIVIQVVNMTEGQLVVSNRDEDIDLTVPADISAFFSLNVGENGAIEATNFPFTTDLVQRNRLNLISGDGTVDVSGSIRGEGNIYVRGSRGE